MDLQAWLQALSGVVGGVGLGILVFLLVKGIIVTATAADERVRVQQEACDKQLGLIQAAHADTLTALNLAHDNRVRQLTQRLDAIVADRDAWHEAYTEEAAARRAAETATRQLMESGNVTMALLSALKDSLARTPPASGQGRSE